MTVLSTVFVPTLCSGHWYCKDFKVYTVESPKQVTGFSIIFKNSYGEIQYESLHKRQSGDRGAKGILGQSKCYHLITLYMGSNQVILMHILGIYNIKYFLYLNLHIHLKRHSFSLFYSNT